jgi:DNA-directed RNA polymerase subunit N
MIIPIRCFSCGKPLGHLWKKYEELLAEGKNSKEALDELSCTRFCCRGNMLSNVESIDIIGQF